MSPEGRFTQLLKPESNVLRLDGSRTTPTPFLATPVNERWPAFSPDGQWIAYTSDETGHFELFVAPYPGPGRKWQVSRGGGAFPWWRRDGGEIVYATDDRLMSVAIDTRSTFRSEPPWELTQLPPHTDYFAMAPDGERFVVTTARASCTWC